MHAHHFQDEASRVLIAGCSADLPAIQRLIAELPPTAYGQIYIEIAAAIQVRRWSVPPGVVVTWLRRDLAGWADAVALPKGDLLVRAVSAWMSEWLPEQDPAVPALIWLGGRTSRPVDELHGRLARHLAATHVETSASDD